MNIKLTKAMHSPEPDVGLNHERKDYLWLNISVLPYFRGLLRAVEARFYQDIQLESPTLDIGCGDGHFASVAFERPLEAGIDPWNTPIHEAKMWNSYTSLIQGDAGQMPFPNSFFSSGVSNSVLEHIPELDHVLCEIARVLKPGALFVFCVPNHLFLDSLSIGQFLDRVHLHSLADSYRSFFNKLARHYHSDPPEKWIDRLEKAGFVVDQFWHYYPPEALRISEWGHLWGIPTLLTRKLTGRWIFFPYRWNPFLFLINHILRKHYDRNPICENGVCSFYITRRIA